jgi:hypothetical protein
MLLFDRIKLNSVSKVHQRRVRVHLCLQERGAIQIAHRDQKFQQDVVALSYDIVSFSVVLGLGYPLLVNVCTTSRCEALVFGQGGD